MSGMTDKTCAFTDWRTPSKVLDPVRAYFRACGYEGIELDPATTDDNPVGAGVFYTVAQDGLVQPWAPLATFVNPPYGRGLRNWCAKIGAEARGGCPLIALLPGQRFEQGYFQDSILRPENLDAIVFIRSRLSFVKPDGSRSKGNPFGSMLYVYNTPGGAEGCKRLETHLAPLGLIMIPGSTIMVQA